VGRERGHGEEVAVGEEVVGEEAVEEELAGDLREEESERGREGWRWKRASGCHASGVRVCRRVDKNMAGCN
jgi:hypothetical protein